MPTRGAVSVGVHARPSVLRRAVGASAEPPHNVGVAAAGPTAVATIRTGEKPAQPEGDAKPAADETNDYAAAGLSRRQQRRLIGPGQGRLETAVRLGAVVLITTTCALFAWNTFRYAGSGQIARLTSIYTVLMAVYILSRFLFAMWYRPPRDIGYLPSVAVVVPSFNEGAGVARTIHSCLAVDYPGDRIEVVVVDDGSTDDTWQHMQDAAAMYPPGRVRCLALSHNQGKRAAMAAGIRATTADVLVFVDSDSMPAPEAIRQLVQGLADERVGAVSGITHVRNARTNVLTKMQMARYYVSFQLLKSAESVVGAVACCSGCFAAYRRSAIDDVLDGWENQRFLGTECTFGDDRALTNMILKSGWTTIYDGSAEAWTDAPDSYHRFFKQQLRWKKSWCREGPLLLAHIWRSRLRAFPFVLMATMAGLLSPLVMALNFAYPFVTGEAPVWYLAGLFLVAMSYAMFYRAMRNDGLWLYAFLGTFFYISFSPQLLWALARIRDGAWGTRPSTVGSPASATIAGGSHVHP